MPFLLQAWLFLTIALSGVLLGVVILQAVWARVKQQLAERPLTLPARAAVVQRSG